MRKWNVLVVEDDPDAAKLIGAQLEDLDLNVRVAHDGQEAILVTGSVQPELVILDLVMPQLDGIETSRYFKHKFRNGYLPILVLTAASDAETRQQCGLIGCDELLAKPYTESDLRQGVSDLIELSRNERRLAQVLVARQDALKEKGKGRNKEATEAGGGLATLEDRICEIRLSIAERLIGRGFVELVPVHVARIEGLRPEHAELRKLRARVA